MSEESAQASQVERILELSPKGGEHGRFVVICPTYNRAPMLPRALDSLLAQTYRDWLCVILDDGSTDGTSRVGEDYARRDPRFVYARFDENRGGVVMNDIGMRVACEVGEYWSRLGSDDWFEPHKLMVDYVTLGRNELPACFGPYRSTADHLFDRILSSHGNGFFRTPGRLAMSWADAAIRSEPVRRLRQRFGEAHERLQSPPVDAREVLLSGEFAVSWANVAVRSEVLRKVRDRFGAFCHSDSRNMEDFHCNARIASLSSIAWRGLMRDRKTLVIGATTWADAGAPSEFVHDGTWRMASDGASNNRDQFALDSKVTLAAIQDDFARYAPEPCPAIRPRVVRL